MAGPDPRDAAARLAADDPRARRRACSTHLRDDGHAAYVVGGSLRDALLRPRARRLGPRHRRPAAARSLELFPGAVYENRFGTVAVRRDGDGVRDHDVPRSSTTTPTHRRPHRVEFGDDLEADLARRDFTVNALAWGGPADRRRRRSGRRSSSTRSAGCATSRPASCGPSATRWRGCARTRCGWSGRSGSPPRTTSRSRPRRSRRSRPTPALVAHLSGERVGAELSRLLEAPRPSVGLRRRGGHGPARRDRRRSSRRSAGSRRTRSPARTCGTTRSDPWTPRPPSGRIVRLAALLHDVGKPATLADGRFHHHDVVGAEQAAAILRRLRVLEGHGRGRRPPRPPPHVHGRGRPVGRRPSGGSSGGSVASTSTPCSSCAGPTTSGAACRRTTRRTAAFRARIDAELAARPPLDRGALAIDGDDLIRELGLEPGSAARPRARRPARARHRRPGPQRPGHADAARTGHACRHAG